MPYLTIYSGYVHYVQISCTSRTAQVMADPVLEVTPESFSHCDPLPAPISWSASAMSAVCAL
jgi:hypothetical protein